MDQTFLININCSRILFDSQETQYTMFIDTNKISIVYELIEWIRWIFSVETCIYITHENSVIHELEDIRVLAKMKNFEIKPCGQPRCVHKKAYRALLSNLNLFVSWNETKVHKYFLEKLSQMDVKFIQKEIKPESLIKKSTSKRNKEIISENSCNNEYSVSTVNYSQHCTEQAFINDSTQKSDIGSSSFIKTHEDVLIYSEDNSENSILSNLSSRHISTNHKNCVSLSPAKTFIKNQSDTKGTNCAKSKISKNSRTFVRPFSLGQLLTSMKENLEKESSQVIANKNTCIGEENFECTPTSENLNETNTSGEKKRRRIRKRKKPRKSNLEIEQTSLPIFKGNGFIENMYNFNSSSYIKPNHIRFDVEDENKFMETDVVEDDLSLKNKNEVEVDLKSNDSNLMYIEAEPVKLTESNHQEFLNSHPSSPVKNKMENSVLEAKVIDLDEQVLDIDHQPCGISGSSEADILNEDLNMLQSLKDKFKNAVVKRFY